MGTTGFSTSSYFLTAAITCPVPSTLTATSITNTSAVWGWSAIAGALSYNVQYRVAGTIPWTVIASPANSVIVATLTPATTYEFQVEAVCPSGELSGFSGSKTFTTTNKALLTLGSGQDNNFIIYPNPVTQYATLSYSLGTSAQVSVVIYNVLGQEVLPVVKNETQSPGSHEYSTGLLPAGIYYVKCTIGESVVTRKMVKL